MLFEPVPRLVLRWRTEAGDGLEHVEIRPVGGEPSGGLTVSGTLIAPPEDGGRAIGYRLAVDGDWRVVSFDLDASDGTHIALRSNGAGRWSDGDGTPLPALNDALDIDLGGTPLTNLLPVRRLFGEGRRAAADLQVVYIEAATLAVSIQRQRYEPLRPGRLYRYVSLDTGFTADLPVDRHGLVVDYPGLWRRVSL
ncbi:putative glycolipid-binding domain-containing protein [Methylobrevis pamukkalensis]|uniref:Uncharacterized protein n=1 Tax=Methylobrevis pamukkalensis TaxID=1439726 RepID=A0A1E3H152_9HYPH|nr:putative glycolipid-binding domain-containing protein [Methylobrevis pamukkalensis]ODN70049.1 hypothetical protein A6302_02646 [Methylobrevis pamukkalensis]